MALPENAAFRHPVLVALSGGAVATNEAVRARVKAHMELTDEECDVPAGNGQTVFVNRVAFAFKDLQPRGLLEKAGERPNRYRITPAGEYALAKDLDLAAIPKRSSGPDDAPEVAIVLADGEPTRTVADASEPLFGDPEPSPGQARPFDADRPPKQGDFRWIDLDREAKHQLQEKARQAHHELLAGLAQWLGERGWTEILEIPGSIDLWAVSPVGRRWIFEAKTISDGNELSQTRGALGQLLEYRLMHGKAEDGLCVAVNRAVRPVRAELLGRLEIAVCVVGDDEVQDINDIAQGVTE